MLLHYDIILPYVSLCFLRYYKLGHLFYYMCYYKLGYLFYYLYFVIMPVDCSFCEKYSLVAIITFWVQHYWYIIVIESLNPYSAKQNNKLGTAEKCSLSLKTLFSSFK